jgi:malate dehydrogenase (oxaloacetate-decarboxylating)
VVSDGTAVLGLGNIGASASLPVMEGKAALFQKFAGLDSIPLVIESTDVDEIVETVVRLRSSFGAVNLEDISAPRCFEIEARLIEALDMPVMHDDQHGTAVVVLAALTNAAKVVQRELSSLKVVVSGAGAAGIAVAEILMAAGIADVTILDSKGIIHSGREELSGIKATYAERTNPRGTTGGSAEALNGADVFVGVSAGTIPEEQLAGMSEDAIVFALSNPDPEVHPDIARRYAKVVATGRSDFPNQINNVLAFPGIFRGALDSGAKKITSEMKVAAAKAIADIAASDLSADSGRRKSSPTAAVFISWSGKVLRTPFGGHQEARNGDAESDHDVPGTGRRNGPLRLGDVEDDDPQQADDHQAEHHRLEPHRVRLVLGRRRRLRPAFASFAGLRLWHGSSFTGVKHQRKPAVVISSGHSLPTIEGILLERPLISMF